MINAGYLISYDYEYVFLSLKQVYDYVDKIYLAIDINRKTWVGNTFVIAESFFLQIKAVDTLNKICIYEEDFYIPANTPMQNETRERVMLAEKMGVGWCMQLDADEYVLNFDQVAQYLNNNKFLLRNIKRTPALFQGSLITIFKILKDGILYIENDERFNFITNTPEFTAARNNTNITPHFTNIKIIHQSWARTPEDVLLKIKNWGHRNDFDTAKFYEFWEKLNSTNYKDFKNFHPLVPTFWNEFKFSPHKNVEKFVEEYNAKKIQQIIDFPINQKIGMRLKAGFF